MEKRYAIIAIGYNRPDSMRRLLNSLAQADYENDNVTLIISIDNSGVDTVVECAKKFDWIHGEKRVVTYAERQGLRAHILKCGNFLKEFDAIAVFEDDIVVAKGFYQFMKLTVDKYYDNAKIAGISLYKHLWNVNVNMPFEPASSIYDTYFMQFAQSWGQIWMKKQWFDFISWYEKNNEEFSYAKNVPEFVAKWPKTSWLKYHIKYCVEENKYFVYPNVALSTCFSDVGEHTGQKMSYLQVPLLEGIKKTYSFPEVEDKDAVKYDAFFERKVEEGLCKGIELREICMDLYGNKKSYEDKKYVISNRSLPYRIVDCFGLEYRPHEANILNEIPGNEFLLYDLGEKCDAHKENNKIEAFLFYFRLFRRDKQFLKCIFWHAWMKIKRIFKR